MFKPFFSILINKKTLFFIFLLIILGFSLPRITFAYATFPGTNPIGASEKTADKCASELSMFESIVAGMADLFTWIPEAIAWWVVNFTSWVISIALDWPVTNTSSGDGGALAFAAGWRSTRDLANMLIVLGFVVIGIATALRFKDYEAKKLLPKLIVIALLINFSGLFCGLFIDSSKILMKGLVDPNGATSGSMGIAFWNNIKNAEKEIKCEAAKQGLLGKYVETDALLTFLYVIVAICFVYLSVMLLARYAVLGILFILSPLAFVFWAFPFPKAKDLWDSWWSNFIKWVFIGVGICFFLNLAGQVLANYPSMTSTSNLFFYLMVVVIIIVVGIKISIRSSAAGAAAVIGLASGGIGLAMGAMGKAGMGTLKGLANKTGLSNVGNKIKSGATRLGESMSLVAPGTSAGMEAKRLDEPKKRLASFDSKRLASIAQQSAWTKKASEDKAAATHILSERGDLTEITDENARSAAIAHASSFPGIKRSDFEKSDYRMAAFNDSKVRSQLVAAGLTPAAAAAVATGSPQYVAAQQRAVQTQLESNWGSMSQNDRQKVDIVDLTPEFIGRKNAPDLNAYRLLPGGHATRLHLRSLVGNPGAPLNPALQIENDLNNAIATNDTTEIRRLTSLRTRLQSM